MRAASGGAVFFIASAAAQGTPSASAALDPFECVLPYIGGGDMVNVVSSADVEQVVEITVMDSYRYSVVVPKNSRYSFASPVFRDFFVRIKDGGPISFKSERPLTVYTVLADEPVTVMCSELTERTKLFVGGPKTRIALVNTTKSPLTVQIFKDNEKTPVLALTMAAQERKLSRLEELFSLTGTHAFRVVADRDGMGFAVISSDRSSARSPNG
jgi:hypothetical protein